MNKEAIKLLEDIKRLMILDLIERGIQANVIADILGITKGMLSKIVPARKIKKQNQYDNRRR